jgi:hypothetical protein
MAGSAVTIQRQIIGGGGGVIFPDCVVEEVGTDTLQITEHPVEGPITGVVNDHAFKKPREVNLRWSWSDSSNINHPAEQGIVIEIYNSLLSLQASLSPFIIYTGKSAYSNMLLQSLKQTTSKDSEFSLQINALCKEIIIVETSTTSAGVPSTASASNMSNPSATAPITQTGQATLKPTASDFGDPITSTTQFG